MKYCFEYTKQHISIKDFEEVWEAITRGIKYKNVMRLHFIELYKSEDARELLDKNVDIVMDEAIPNPKGKDKTNLTRRNAVCPISSLVFELFLTQTGHRRFSPLDRAQNDHGRKICTSWLFRDGIDFGTVVRFIRQKQMGEEARHCERKCHGCENDS